MAFVPRATVGDLSGLTSLRKSIIVNIDGKLTIVKPKFFVFISFLIQPFAFCNIPSTPGISNLYNSNLPLTRSNFHFPSDSIDGFHSDVIKL